MDTEPKTLDELLNDEPNEAPVASEPPEAARDEQGRFVAKGETEGAPPAPAEPKAEEPKLDHAAIVAERRRRQEAEQRAQALEAEVKALREPPAPPASVWEDEEGFRSDTVSEAVRQATFNARLDMSEMMVRQAHPDDFDEVKAEFIRLMGENPSLQQQALADAHPWNRAYQIAKTHKAMAELGATDVDGLRAKIREELMAEMQTVIPAPRPGLPPTLTTERNVGTRSGPVWSGPPSLDELLR